MKLRDYIGKWISHGMVSPKLYLVDVIEETEHSATAIFIDMSYKIVQKAPLYPPVKLLDYKNYHKALKIVFEGNRD